MILGTRLLRLRLRGKCCPEGNKKGAGVGPRLVGTEFRALVFVLFYHEALGVGALIGVDLEEV